MSGRLRLRVGRRLRALPHTASAWVAGALSDGQVEVIVASVTDGAPGSSRSTRPSSLAHFARLDVAETERAMQD